MRFNEGGQDSQSSQEERERMKDDKVAQMIGSQLWRTAVIFSYWFLCAEFGTNLIRNFNMKKPHPYKNLMLDMMGI